MKLDGEDERIFRNGYPIEGSELWEELQKKYPSLNAMDIDGMAWSTNLILLDDKEYHRLMKLRDVNRIDYNYTHKIRIRFISRDNIMMRHPIPLEDVKIIIEYDNYTNFWKGDGPQDTNDLFIYVNEAFIDKVFKS
jgi:hypothetical protein